ncbi:aldo/keto reductase [Caproiciproducens sp. CPB-2]|uniref:aldo/keto reductase n=1 Tax=Caproiciproducens sp. CPB-2 TaxID=3030017 RepID=UPI0023DABE77|nr:aldo/keto reductase [Caproiciproducens sp. CPB-2]MDF1494537.1 aldo/keto reductase [Caproiciproducens sp. CPB-2]
MRYKKFQKANVDISVISVGTWAIGGKNYGPVDRNDSIAAIHAMIDAGVNHIDTAPIYGDGASERLVGEALKGIRDKVYVTAKFGTYHSGYTGEVIRDAHYDSVLAFCEKSLERLGLDYIDFYFLHWPDPQTSVEETMAAMKKLKEQGKIRFIGVSNHTIEQMEEVQKYIDLDVIQPPFSMVNQSAREVINWAYERGISTMTYGSLGAGILTGTIRSLPHFDPNDTRVRFYDFYREPKFSKVMELLKLLDKISYKYKRPLSQIVINWTTQQPFVGTALVGVRNPKEAQENCAAFDWQLENGDIELITKALNDLKIG